MLRQVQGRRLRAAWLVTAAIGAAAPVAQAQAQAQDAGASSPAAPAAAAPASAESQTATTTPNETVRSTVEGRETIIVTARHYVPTGSITANKTDIPLIQTPQSISVITRDQIDLLNFIDAQQAVRYTAGVFGENYGPDPRYDFITVRGFTPRQYIDGLAVPATSTIASTGVDLYAFESLDILKGPSSALYGLAPPGGIINETSRRPSSTAGGEIEAKYGTHNFAEIATTVTGPAAPDLDLRFTGLFRDADTIIDHTNAKRVMVSPSATLKLGDTTKLTGLLYYQYDRNHGGQGGFLPEIGTRLPNPNGRIKRSTNLDDPADRFDRRQYGTGYDLEHRFAPRIVFHSNSKWSHYNEKTPVGLYGGGGYVTNNALDATDAVNFRDVRQYNFSYAEKVVSFATDNRLDAAIDTGNVHQKVLLGIDYRNVRNVAAYGFGFGGVLNAFDPVYDPTFAQDIGFPTRYNQQRLKQTGVYGQDQIGFGDLFVTLGGRYDWVSGRSATNTFTTVTTPAVFEAHKQHKFTYRVGANYVTDAGIAPYVSYATSFEPVLGTDIVTAKAFNPTSSKQYEAGVKFDGRGLPEGFKVFATAAAFDVKERNFVAAQAGTGLTTFSTQGGLVEIYGVEFELVARINDQLTLNAAYSYNHSKIKKSENSPGDEGLPLPTTPKHKASVLADYTFQQGAPGGLGFGFGARYDSSSSGGLGSPIVTGRATLFDAIVHYDLPGWRFAVNGSNIFDKRYVARCAGPYGCVYGQDRQVIGTITKKF